MPTHTQLCSTGFAGGFSVTAFRSRFTVLRISRARGDRASPLHLGERNDTSTGPKLSKTSSVHVPHPWRMRHFEGTDRSLPLCPALPDSLDGRHSVEYYGSAAPTSALVTSPPIHVGSSCRFRRCSSGNFSASFRCPSVTLVGRRKARYLTARLLTPPV